MLVTLAPSPAGTVAVTVTGPAVAALQVAVPNAGSGGLAMLALMGSETDQVAFGRLLKIKAQPDGSEAMKAANCCLFPGGAAA